MANYKENDYFQILNSSIRMGVAVPFTCYFLLSGNGRIVPCVRAYHFPNIDLLNKLRSGHSDKLYIEKAEMDKYTDYLKEFFKSDEGCNELHGILMGGEDASDLVGIPQKLQEKFGLETRIVEGDASGDNGKVILQTKEEITSNFQRATGNLHEIENTTHVAGMAKDQLENEATAISGGKEEDPNFKNLIRALKEQFKGPHAVKVKGLLRDFNYHMKEITRITENNKSLTTQEIKNITLTILQNFNNDFDQMNEQEIDQISSRLKRDFSELKGRVMSLPGGTGLAADPGSGSSISPSTDSGEKISRLKSESNLEEENKSLRKQVAELTEALAQKDKQLKKMGRENRSAEEKMEEFSQFIEDNSQYIGNLEGEVKTLRNSLMEIEKNLFEKNNENEKLIRKKLEFELQMERDKNAKKDYVNLINELKMSLADKMKEIDKTTQVMGSFEKKNLENGQQGLADIIASNNHSMKLNFENMEKLRDKNSEIQKKYEQIQSQAEGLSILKSRLGAGLEKLEIQKKNFISKQESLNSKIVMLTNLNEQGRRTIDRLNKVAEMWRSKAMNPAKSMKKES